MSVYGHPRSTRHEHAREIAFDQHLQQAREAHRPISYQVSERYRFIMTADAHVYQVWPFVRELEHAVKP